MDSSFSSCPSSSILMGDTKEREKRKLLLVGGVKTGSSVMLEQSSGPCVHMVSSSSLLGKYGEFFHNHIIMTGIAQVVVIPYGREKNTTTETH